MIKSELGTVQFNGTLSEIVADFSVIMEALYQTLKADHDGSRDEARKAIAEIGRNVFMIIDAKEGRVRDENLS